MEIRQLRSFQTVANLLSFNKAADRLHYAQSSISAQIHALEEELGLHLFDRLGKRVQLTESGSQLLHYANKILDLVNETESELTADREPLGSLTVRIPESFGVHRLPEVIREFHSRFPKVQLNFITCAHEGLAKDLRKGITDLAFLLAESISSSDLFVETLGFEPVVLTASPAHPLAAKRVVHTRDLAGETILLSKVDCSYRKIFEQILEQEEVASVHKLEFHSVEVIKRCLMAGVGVTVLPEIAVAEEVARKQLVILPWSEDKIEVALLMIWYRDRWVSPTLKAFMDVTKNVMARSG
jgi:DNA-binding transcriptional LysR family regulator